MKKFVKLGSMSARNKFILLTELNYILKDIIVKQFISCVLINVKFARKQNDQYYSIILFTQKFTLNFLTRLLILNGFLN